MSSAALGRLEKVSARSVWPNEATDFTPWLATEQHFEILADTLHFVDAEVESTEASIGSFSADIVARDRDGYVLVENQLEQTDHTHLGQILTYLAGLEGAAKVVWISTKVREEHRAAVDWLNENTDSAFSFFAVEIEVVRIGDSPVAPLFHVVAKPNEWSRHINRMSKAIGGTATNDRQKRYQEFWGHFARYIDERAPGLRRSSPPKDHWWQFPTGRSGYSFTLTAVGRDHVVGVELYMHEDADKICFDHFMDQREEIERAFGAPLTWERLDDKKGSRIVIRQSGLDPMDQSAHPKIFAWYAENLESFRRVFRERIRVLDLDELQSSDAA